MTRAGGARMLVGNEPSPNRLGEMRPWAGVIQEPLGVESVDVAAVITLAEAWFTACSVRDVIPLRVEDHPRHRLARRRLAVSA